MLAVRLLGKVLTANLFRTSRQVEEKINKTLISTYPKSKDVIAIQYTYNLHKSPRSSKLKETQQLVVICHNRKVVTADLFETSREVEEKL